MKNLTLAISTCPNDTFMFDAIVNEKIDLKGYKFDTIFNDIDLLNKNAKSGKADISKLSCAVAAQIREEYDTLRSGAAMGHGNAPLLVSRRKIYPDEVGSCKIAIPGYDTTAKLLLEYNFNEIREIKPYLFSDIMDAIHSDEVDAGVLIHEERFSYRQNSLLLIADLAEKWNSESNLPIPLGLIGIKSSIDNDIKRDISQLIAESVRFGFNNREESWKFIKSKAQSLSDEVIESHIEMFVNNFSIDMGDIGIKAVERMFNIALKGESFNKPIFV